MKALLMMINTLPWRDLSRSIVLYSLSSLSPDEHRCGSCSTAAGACRHSNSRPSTQREAQGTAGKVGCTCRCEIAEGGEACRTSTRSCCPNFNTSIAFIIGIHWGSVTLRGNGGQGTAREREGSTRGGGLIGDKTMLMFSSGKEATPRPETQYVHPPQFWIIRACRFRKWKFP